MLLKKKKSALVLEREQGGTHTALSKVSSHPWDESVPSLPPQLPAALALCF